MKIRLAEIALNEEKKIESDEVGATLIDQSVVMRLLLPKKEIEFKEI
jgi:hypothetical protein